VTYEKKIDFLQLTDAAYR